MQTAADSLGRILKAADPQASYETELQGRWSRAPLDVELPLSGGGSFRALSRGTWNVEAGPDFLNAKIAIDGKTLRGDVEVHRCASDWFAHKHQSDPAYSKVILHVVERDDSKERLAPRIPTYVLTTSKGSAAKELAPPMKGKCARRFSSLPPESLRAVFRSAGVERMGEKASAILMDMISGGESAAFLKKLFDAAGFKRNRKAFLDTLSRFLEHPEETRKAQFRALLWGESGLLPDPSTAKLQKDSLDCAKRLWEAWWPLRPQAREPIEWTRSGSRPLNSPERRLAYVCALIERLGENPLPLFASKLASLSPQGFNEFILEALSANDPFWDARTSFEGKPLKSPASIGGEARALDLAINVALPCVLAYARLKADAKLGRAAEDCLLLLPSPESNRIFKNAMERWFLEPAKASKALSGAAARQGVLHIYGSYCDKIAADCASCLVFNSM